MACACCCEDEGVVLVHCTGCNFRACLQCHQRYLLDTTLDWHCMQCHHPWNFEFMYRHFPLSWFRRWWTGRGAMLLKRDKANMEEVIPFLEQDTTYRQLLLKLKSSSFGASVLMLDHVIRMENQQMEWRIYGMESIPRWQKNPFTEEVKAKPTVVACLSQRCKGYLNALGQCLCCASKWCLACGEEEKEEEDHKCQPSDQASMAWIRSSTRSCPQCQTPIQRIDGCDHMFCVVCHTFFSYQTGQRIYQVVTNPHHTQRQQQQMCPPLPRFTHRQHPILQTWSSAIDTVSKDLLRWRHRRDHLDRPEHCSIYLRYLWVTDRLSDAEWESILMEEAKSEKAATEYVVLLQDWLELAGEHLREATAGDVEQRWQHMLDITQWTNQAMFRVYQWTRVEVQYPLETFRNPRLQVLLEWSESNSNEPLEW
jgi:hypothetical protein